MEKQIKLENGFELTIDDVVLDDMELVDLLGELEDDPMKIGKVVKKVLGDQKNALYDHVRTEDGRVPVSVLTDAITEIFEALGEEAKN